MKMPGLAASRFWLELCSEGIQLFSGHLQQLFGIVTSEQRNASLITSSRLISRRQRSSRKWQVSSSSTAATILNERRSTDDISPYLRTQIPPFHIHDFGQSFHKTDFPFCQQRLLTSPIFTLHHRCRIHEQDKLAWWLCERGENADVSVRYWCQ